MIRLALILLISIVSACSCDAQALYAYMYGGKYRLNSQGYCCNNPRCYMRAEAHRQWLILTGRAQAPVVTATPTVEAKREAMKAAEEELCPMPMEAIPIMLDLVRLEPGETLYDLGCGDGRILIEANGWYRASVLGVEINKETHAKCLENMKRAGCRGYKVILGDATKTDLQLADVVTLYLYDHVMERIRFDSLKSGARVVSYMHPIPGLSCKHYQAKVGDWTHDFYLYRKP